MFGDPYVFLVTAVFLIPAALVAIPVHEMAHALAAQWQGDPTPRNRGFLRYDPRLFIEPYGLIAVFLAKVAWGQPVPINEYRLRGVWGRVGYAVAGPGGNLLVAIVSGIALRALLGTGAVIDQASLVQTPVGYVAFIVYAIFFLNLSTFAFNLLPIPGLDGWRILEALFRHRNARFFFDANMRRREIWMVAVLVVFVASFLGYRLLAVVLIPFFAPASDAIVGQCLGYYGLLPCPG
ncbi:MAG: site-2 protease family protein [Candidatus Dormibacteraceae bacterium]